MPDELLAMILSNLPMRDAGKLNVMKGSIWSRIANSGPVPHTVILVDKDGTTLPPQYLGKTSALVDSRMTIIWDQAGLSEHFRDLTARKALLKEIEKGVSYSNITIQYDQVDPAPGKLEGYDLSHALLRLSYIDTPISICVRDTRQGETWVHRSKIYKETSSATGWPVGLEQFVLILPEKTEFDEWLRRSASLASTLVIRGTTSTTQKDNYCTLMCSEHMESSSDIDVKERFIAEILKSEWRDSFISDSALEQYFQKRICVVAPEIKGTTVQGPDTVL